MPTVSALDALVDKIAREATRVPVSVELTHAPGHSMFIVVGGRESHMEFRSPQYDPQLWVCTGPWNDDDDALLGFSHHGQWSEVPRRFAIPYEHAREALRRFFLTGDRPVNVKWEPA